MAWLIPIGLFSSGFLAGVWWGTRTRPDLRASVGAWETLLAQTANRPTLGSRARQKVQGRPMTPQGPLRGDSVWWVRGGHA